MFGHIIKDMVSFAHLALLYGLFFIVILFTKRDHTNTPHSSVLHQPCNKQKWPFKNLKDKGSLWSESGQALTCGTNQMDEKRKNVQPWQTLCARWQHIHDTCNVHMQSEDPLIEKTKQSWRGIVSQEKEFFHLFRSLKVEGTASWALVPVLLRPNS